jgi:cobalt-zinc-cadmium efflux system outer membrane protein
VAAAAVFPNPTLDLGREQVFSPGGPAEQHRLGVQADIQIAGKRDLRRAIAQTGVTIAEAEAARDLSMLVHDFRQAYASAFHHEARARLLDEGIGVYGRLERIVEIRRRTGESAGYDVLRLHLERTGIESLRTDAQSLAAEQRAKLAGLLGQPLEGPLSLTPLHDVPNSDVLLTEALARRSDLRAIRAGQEQASLSLNLAQRSSWSDPALALGLKQTNEPTVQGLGYTAGLLWPLPLFNRGQGEVARAEAELARLKAEETAIQAQLRAAIPAARQVLVDRLATSDRFRRDVIPRLPQVVTVAETAYREGEQGIAALLDAYRTALEARLRLLDIDAATQTARLDLERLLESPLSAPQRTAP